MVRKRLTLSLLAFFGSLFLFVFATFAWFLVSEWVDFDPSRVMIVNVDVSATLFVSEDGINYTEASQIEFSNEQPGATSYYKLTIENTGNVATNVKAFLFGFSDAATDETKTYDDTKSLLDVTLLDITNSQTAESYEDLMSDLMPSPPSGDYSSQALYLTTGIMLPVDDIVDIMFVFTLDGDLAGNDYQNLKLLISSIIVSALEG
ncbi:MAG: hypothetical protein WC466_09850 [Candidatus Izemoplasmatales bacterium]